AIRFLEEVLRRLPSGSRSVKQTTTPSSDRSFTGALEALDFSTRRSVPARLISTGKSNAPTASVQRQVAKVGGLLPNHRPHGALDGQTTYERLLAKRPDVTSILGAYTKACRSR